MDLGVFSISLAVKDISASRRFYEQLGFAAFGGDEAQRWLIMKQGQTPVGLFQGMLEKNTLRFNPGWNADAASVDPFTDMRELHCRLKAQGMKLTQEADESGSGPTFFTLEDPDGNPVLVDQHR